MSDFRVGSRFALLIREALSEPILVLGLILRLMIWAYVISTGHWLGGDSNHYLNNAEMACSGVPGAWGGDGLRPMLYSWFLCLLSPAIKNAGSELVQNSGWFAGPLFVQMLMIWFAGVALWKAAADSKARRAIAACWLFDPSILVYGSVLMSDAFCAVLVLGMALSWRYRRPVLAGVFWGAVLLTRSVGVMFSIATLVILFWGMISARDYRERITRVRTALISFSIALALVAPLLLHNISRGEFSLGAQSRYWITTVAALVDNHGSGLSAIETEAKWNSEGHSRIDIWNTLLIKKPHLFLYYSGKGWVRVFLGHVNTEFAYIVTGQSPIGPGWFKVRDRRQGPSVSGYWTIAWGVGVLATALYYLWVYRQIWFLARAWIRQRVREKISIWTDADLYQLWLFCGLAIFGLTPLVFGDARFRAPLWPLVLLLWSQLSSRKKIST